MLKTLARKEIRELLPLVLLAAILELFLAATAIGMRLGFFGSSNIGQIPFVSEEKSGLFFCVAGGAALALGLWQTMLESTRGTFQFLLHRPLARAEIFGVKLAVGLISTVAVAVLPVACYGLWAATPGTHASPFYWSMTTWAWLLCAQMPLVYLGAFMSGLRPGRWFGSRFLPLIAVVGAVILLQLLREWPWVALLATVAIGALLVEVILDVGRSRDFS